MSSLSLNLSELNGNNGFTIFGAEQDGLLGTSVSIAGDVNDDGIDDLIVGANLVDVDDEENAGRSYVIFGSSEAFPNSFDVSTLDGSNGFVINGIDEDDESGASVSRAGDINGDGVNDLIIGAYRANDTAGESYVVFGTDSGEFPESLNLNDLNGSNGFTIRGISEDDFSGISVSNLGDLNNDGIDDLTIGANRADSNGNQRSGETYVVFGSEDEFPETFNLEDLNGDNGFIINGIDDNDRSGRSVSGAGDFNGDGIEDLIIGAYSASDRTGQSYVVFGRDDFPDSLDASDLDGSNGFVINSVNSGGGLGISLSSAGDVNGDGLDDLIVGAAYAESRGNSDAGESYIIFGTEEEFPADFNVFSLDGSNGFAIGGIDRGDLQGISVSNAGDFNNDGIGDLLIGARAANPEGRAEAGQSYLLFGNRNGFDAVLDLSDFNNANGLVLNGVDPNDLSGASVSTAGDINDDGLADIVIGAPQADSNDTRDTGESYVIFGDNQRFLTLPDFSRGPEQEIENISDDAAGIPITVDNAEGVTTIEFTFSYDQDLLNVTGVNLSAALEDAGWEITDRESDSGQEVITLEGEELPDGETNAVDLVFIEGTVPDDADYAVTNTLELGAIELNGGDIDAVEDTATHQVAYLGDSSGNGSYSLLDSYLIARAAVDLDRNFAAYPDTNPRVVGDVTGEGLVSAIDAANIAREVAGLPIEPPLPDIPG